MLRGTDALQSSLVGRIDTVEYETDDDSLPSVSNLPSFDSSIVRLLSELGELPLDHISNVEHQSVQSSSEQDLVLVVSGL